MSELLFGRDFSAVAERAIRLQDPSLVKQFVAIVGAINHHPELAPKYKRRNASDIDPEVYVLDRAEKYAKTRIRSADPTRPTTIPDEMVSLILHEFYKVPEPDLARIKETHQWSMAAENKVGELLERYLASVLEPLGWAWCAGSSVKSVDFVLPPAARRPGWVLLQVKNRDNSENSSSSSVRDGTDIVKWFRSYSRQNKTNWDNFPVDDAASLLCEEDFRQFVVDYFNE